MKYERILVCHFKLDLESSGPMQSTEEFFRLKGQNCKGHLSKDPLYMLYAEHVTVVVPTGKTAPGARLHETRGLPA